ncbi:baculoviral IAP repeat-containing protein 7-like [Lytechinus variegatus]|uniref:baculoviral IAP repeat-containing protein 7-like n=1 Tax=Lytechinus variegatus TaxID=7654 RepID=UPI001BB1EDF7|nr:baculoviral IAP repeat-containing protein 7-like [Lytechinus variegatus]
MPLNEKQTRTKVRGKFHVRHRPDKMKYEAERRQTFKAWSETCPVKPRELAKAGFFYVGVLDRVKCFSCGGQIEGWEEGDTAMGEHKNMYPHCDMVKNQDKINVPIPVGEKRGGSEETDGHVFQNTNVDHVLVFCRLYSTVINCPDFTKEETRLETFRDKWSDEFKLPSSETRWLANAGFFYTGPKDGVRCFHCGGGHMCWEEDDEPWSEHAQSYPTCEWLLAMKGKIFVDEVQEYCRKSKVNAAEQGTPTSDTSSASTPVPRADTASGYAEEVPTNRMDKLMGSATVEFILKNGFAEASVRQILAEHALKMDFSSSDKLIEALQAIEKGNNSTEDKSVGSLDSRIEMQTKGLANLEIKGGPRQEEASNIHSDQKTFVTAKSSGHNRRL